MKGLSARFWSRPAPTGSRWVSARVPSVLRVLLPELGFPTKAKTGESVSRAAAAVSVVVAVSVSATMNSPCSINSVIQSSQSPASAGLFASRHCIKLLHGHFGPAFEPAPVGQASGTAGNRSTVPPQAWINELLTTSGARAESPSSGVLSGRKPGYGPAKHPGSGLLPDAPGLAIGRIGTGATDIDDLYHTEIGTEPTYAVVRIHAFTVTSLSRL